MTDEELAEIKRHLHSGKWYGIVATEDVTTLLAEVERLQAERNGYAITLATQRKVAELEAENERLRAEVAELKADSEKFLAEVTTMHRGLNDKRVGVQAENERLRKENDILISIVIRLQDELPRMTCNCGKPNVVDVDKHQWECRYRWVKGDVYEQAKEARQGKGGL